MKRVAKIISIAILILLGLLISGTSQKVEVSFTLPELLLGVGFCFVAYMFYMLYYISVLGDKPNDKDQDAFNSSVISTVGMVLIMFSVILYISDDTYIIVGVLVDVLALMLPFMMKPDPEE